MSRFDAEHKRQWDEAAARDARDFVVGATVYRVMYGGIQEGVVRKAARCNDPDYGEVADGKNPYYAAEFIRAPGCHGDWESQTFAWKFFATRERAVKKLVERLERDIEDKQRDLDKLVRRVAAIRSGEETP